MSKPKKSRMSDEQRAVEIASLFYRDGLGDDRIRATAIYAEIREMQEQRRAWDRERRIERRERKQAIAQWQKSQTKGAE